MGLDMYAARRLYVKNWEHLKPEERYTVQIARGDKPVSGIEPERISVVEEEVMYWRKANHIHGWFVDNVQDGKDDCGTYNVSDVDLVNLLVTCDEVITNSKLIPGTVLKEIRYNRKHPNGLAVREAGGVIEDASVAKRLLPRREGFFFGSYEYDESYLGDVLETARWAARMLADSKAGVPGEIYYSSSW